MSAKRQPLGLGRWIVLIICAMVFFGCVGYIGLWLKDNMKAQNEFKEISLDMDDEAGLKELYKKNQDVIGWVCIDDTKINYPVMQTPDDPEYYLHRDFYGEDSVAGTPFLDAGSVVSGPDKTWNWMIYGHNMKFGTMFHDLVEYESRDFWEDHKIIKLQIITGVKDGEPVISKGEYEIFAAARSRIKEVNSDSFKYYQYSGFSDEDTFNEFVYGVGNESLYNTGSEPEFGEQLVMLSTCAYHTDEGRFYVVGRQVE